jgi:hypothetical protein
MTARLMRGRVRWRLFEALDWVGAVAWEVAGALAALWTAGFGGGQFPLGLAARVEVITPARAREWIAAGSLLGPPNWARALHIAREWQAHEWAPGSADPILRTDTGRLVGRGTRLAAVTLCRMSFKFLVIIVPEAVARRMLEELRWRDSC